MKLSARWRFKVSFDESMTMQLGMPFTNAWMCPGPTHTAILSGEIPLSVSTCERRLPVDSSMPFMHSTNILLCTGYFIILCIKPRRPCELMEIIIISLSLSAYSRSHVSLILPSSSTYSFLPVFLSTSYE